MFDFLTGAVLLLSGIYEGFSLVRAINSLLSLNNALNDLDPGTAAYIQAEGLRNDTIFQIICCSALLLLTLICLLRFVRWAIIGNIAYMTHNTTKDFLKFFHLNSIAELPKLDEDEEQRFELAR